MLAGLLLAACAGGSDRAAPRSTDEAASGATSAPAQTGSPDGASSGGANPDAPPIEQLEGLGRFYLVMGPVREPTRLYAMDWGALDPRPVAPDLIVTNVTSCDDVVVATATSRQDGRLVANWLARVTPRTLSPIEGAGSSTGAPLGADTACRFAYVVRRGESYVVRSWDSKTGDFADLYTTTEPLGRVDFHGGELLLRVGRTDSEWRIVAVRNGQARDLDIDTRPGDAFRVHGSGWIALSDPLATPLVTRLQHLGDGRRLEARGWTPVTWLPGEPRMLVRNEDTLALLSVPSLVVEEVGPWTHDPIWSGAWAP